MLELSYMDMLIVKRAITIALHKNATQRKHAKTNLSCLAMEGADYSILYDRLDKAIKEHPLYKG